MICYVLAMGNQHLGPHEVVGYGIKFFWPGLFITSPDHLNVTGRKRGKSPSGWLGCIVTVFDQFRVSKSQNNLNPH